MLIRSHSAGALIGRGTYGRPWFPKQVSTYLKTGIRLPAPSIIEQRNVVMTHYESMLNHYGKERGIRIARKHLGWYSKGYPKSAEFRADIMKLDSPKTVLALINDFYNQSAERLQRNEQ